MKRLLPLILFIILVGCQDITEIVEPEEEEEEIIVEEPEEEIVPQIAEEPQINESILQRTMKDDLFEHNLNIQDLDLLAELE